MIKTSDDGYVVIGRIGSTFGIKGWLKIYSYTSPKDAIIDYLPWCVYVNNQWQSIKVVESSQQDKNLVVRFEGCDNPEQAKKLTNAELGVSSSRLAKLPEGEFYWSDLIGLSVINQAQKKLGVVSSLLETGANDVLVIKGKKTFAIPFVFGKYVISVNLENKTMVVDWEDDY